MRNEILVAGMDRTDNPLVKVVTEYGFGAVHLSVTPNTPLPKAKAAIVALSHCSHDLMNRVKKEYNEGGRPIFYASGGFSGVKADFEEKMIRPIRDVIKNVSKEPALLFLLGHLYKKGETFTNSRLHEIISHYMELSPPYMSNILRKLEAAGGVKHVQKGKYVFLGIPKRVADDMGMIVPSDWVKDEAPKVEAPVAPPTPVEPPKPVPAVSTEFEQRIEEKINTFMGGVTQKMAMLARQVDIISHSFNPKNRETMIREIVEDLNKMPADELLKIKSMFDIWRKK